MVQGTASHVGKTIIVAGLCRLFRQEGFNVAPFKAQNMALNSFATPDGREIGRAQAMQAEAAGVLPSVDMNPILLKPEGDSRSQVVLRGKVLGTLSAAEYHGRKEELWPVVRSSLDALLSEYELVVIEGAGSPVEVNLKDGDIVNMRVALQVSAPVLLVADIDRGGIFASLVGTMDLLAEEERALVAGFVVNKFRGDMALFASGVSFIEERLGRPVVGVVPWIADLDLPEEDSLGVPTSMRVPSSDERATCDSQLDIVVIRLPHMANFDDFDPLRQRPGVCVRFVERRDDFGEPDLVILPGSKTTRADLQAMGERGLDAAIAAYANAGGCVFGICGGYQMLGTRIDDPEGIEGAPGSSPGLGLLSVVTRFDARKSTVQVRGQVAGERGPLQSAQGTPLVAYEIHMGQTAGPGQPIFLLSNGDGEWRADGTCSADGRILGTYLHGLFANGSVRESLLDWLAVQKGVTLPAAATPIDPFDRLADVLRTSLDLDRLRRIALG